MNRKPKIAIIGAGWAGLSAAVELVYQNNKNNNKNNNLEITLFEASKTAGGRARSLAVEHNFSFLDNGQHLLIGAYQSVFGFLNKIGVSANNEKAFYQHSMRWLLQDGLNFQTKNFLNPINILHGLIQADGAKLLEKWALIRALWKLNHWRNQHQKFNLPDETVQNWLNREKISLKWQYEFFQPIVLGALNTPLESASLRILANVLKDGVWCKPDWSRHYLAREDLGQIVVEPALEFIKKQGVNYISECRVSPIQIQFNHQNNHLNNFKIIIENQEFDKVIIAVAPYHVLNLLPQNINNNINNLDYLNKYNQLKSDLSNINYHAITTVYLKYSKNKYMNINQHFPHAMTGWAYRTAQWLINRNYLNNKNNELAAVISVSDQYGAIKPREWVEKIHQDILSVCPNLDFPEDYQVITEKRATFASTPTRKIPQSDILKDYHIVLAGDYLNPNYPATLETAVQSGMLAAKLII